MNKWPVALGIGALWAVALGLNIKLLPARYLPRVQVDVAQPQEMPIIIRAAGNLEAKDSNTLRAQFDGPVIKKMFREGQKVAQGELLLTIGRKKIQMDYQSRSDALKNAESDLSNSQKEVRLQKALFRKQAVAYSSVEKAERDLVSAKQKLQAAQEAFKLEKERWNSANVISPLSGTVVKDWLQEEKNVGAGREIATIADVSVFTVHTRVDELDIKQVREGQLAEVRLAIYPQVVFRAAVTEVGSSSEGSALMEVPVTMKILGTGKYVLRPKLTAESRIMAGKIGPVLTVPLTAVSNTDGQPKVWVLGAMNRLRERKVELGKSNPERVEIVKGLSPGDRVVRTADPSFADGSGAVLGEPVQNKP